jgi:hypothetical protein
MHLCELLLELRDFFAIEPAPFAASNCRQDALLIGLVEDRP